MTPVLARNRTILVAAFLMPCAGVLLGGFAPGRLHASTLGAVIALLLGSAVVVSSTWRHAQPAVASVRQPRYATDGPRTATSWERWTSDGDRADAHGRALAAFWLSTAVTGLILYAWFA
jgi:hypothetical protein